MMIRKIAAFQVKLEFDPKHFDPSKDLQVAWYDPEGNVHRDYCSHFTSEPYSAKREESGSASKLETLRNELWLIEASIEYDPAYIDIETAQLDVLEFDQETGAILPFPRNVKVKVISMALREREKKQKARKNGLTMASILKSLLDSLADVYASNPEILDTDVREAMADAVWKIYLMPQMGYRLPKRFHLESADANRAVNKAIADFAKGAKKIAGETPGLSFQERLSAFQNTDVVAENGYGYDDLFWMD